MFDPNTYGSSPFAKNSVATTARRVEEEEPAEPELSNRFPSNRKAAQIKIPSDPTPVVPKAKSKSRVTIPKGMTGWPYFAEFIAWAVLWLAIGFLRVSFPAFKTFSSLLLNPFFLSAVVAIAGYYLSAKILSLMGSVKLARLQASTANEVGATSIDARAEGAEASAETFLSVQDELKTMSKEIASISSFLAVYFVVSVFY